MSPSRRRIALLGACALAAATAGLWFGARVAPSPLEGVRFPDLQGRARDLAEWRGKVVVVNFWATWCTPCREEMPLLQQVRESHAKRGVEIVGIAIDSASKVAEFSSTYGISYPILISGAEGLDLIQKLGNKASALPYTVFLDRSGRPVRSKLGILNKAELEAILSDMLG